MARMGTQRHAARRDRNEPEIVAMLGHAGCLVEPLSKRGVPDLLVWSPYLEALMLLEVKDGELAPAKRKLRDVQQIFHDKWKAAGAPVFKVTSSYQALLAVGVPSRKAAALVYRFA